MFVVMCGITILLFILIFLPSSSANINAMYRVISCYLWRKQDLPITINNPTNCLTWFYWTTSLSHSRICWEVIDETTRWGVWWCWRCPVTKCNDMLPFIIRALETPESWEDATMMQVDCSDLVMMLVSPAAACSSFPSVETFEQLGAMATI